eukprot:g1009.t1
MKDKQNRIMTWAQAPVRSSSYTLRTGDGPDEATDPTTYKPEEFMSIHLRVRQTGWKYRGLLVNAVDEAGTVVGKFVTPAEPDYPFRADSPLCPGSLLHADADRKPYSAHFTFKAPPAGTGRITLRALIKRGWANTGYFYWPQKDLVLAEASLARPQPVPVPLPTTTWLVAEDGQSCTKACADVDGTGNGNAGRQHCDAKAMAAAAASASGLMAAIGHVHPVFAPVQVGNGQSFTLSFQSGHRKHHHYVIIIHEDDEHWLSHPKLLQFADEYIKAAPKGSNHALDARWKRYHGTKKRRTDANEMKVYDDDIAGKKSAANNPGLFPRLYERIMPQSDPNFLTHSRWRPHVTHGRLFEYRTETLKVAGDQRVSYPSAKYPWLEAVYRYFNLASLGSDFDLMRVTIPGRKSSGHYIVHWRAVMVSFEPEGMNTSASVPPGFTLGANFFVDHGTRYGKRGSGQAFGWSCDQTLAMSHGIKKQGPPTISSTNVAMDGLCQSRPDGAVLPNRQKVRFSFRVPNGVYAVATYHGADGTDPDINLNSRACIVENTRMGVSLNPARATAGKMCDAGGECGGVFGPVTVVVRDGMLDLSSSLAVQAVGKCSSTSWIQFKRIGDEGPGTAAAPPAVPSAWHTGATGVAGNYVRVALRGERRVFDASVDVNRAAAKADADAMYYTTDDPEDPAFYSTCYFKQSGLQWLPTGRKRLPGTKTWKYQGSCVDCNDYRRNQTCRLRNLSPNNPGNLGPNSNANANSIDVYINRTGWAPLTQLTLGSALDQCRPPQKTKPSPAKRLESQITAGKGPGTIAGVHNHETLMQMCMQIVGPAGRHVPTRVLMVTVVVAGVAWGIGVLAIAATLAMLRRTGTARCSQRMCTYGIGLAAALVQTAACASLATDLAGGIADAHAPWRLLSWFGILLAFGIELPLVTWLVIEPATQFVAGLDMAHLRRVRTVVMRGIVGFLAGLSVAMFGFGLALLGTRAGAQDVGTVIAFASMALGVIHFGVILLRVAAQLAVVLRGLRAASRSAVHVRNLRKTIRFIGMSALQNVPGFVIIATVRQVRALAGVLAFGAAVTMVPPLSVGLYFYERQRLGRGRRVHPRPPEKRWSIDQRKSKVGAGPIVAAVLSRTAELAANGAEARELARAEACPDGLPLNGASLALLKQVAEEFSIGRDTTAADVCARHVKPTTAAARTSLVALLQCAQHASRVAAPWVGAPTIFISYAWSYPYLTLLDIVEQYEAEFPPPKGTTNYYFLDQFSLNQHKFVETVAPSHSATPCPAGGAESQQQMQQELVSALKSQMLKSGHVLMCLWPWHKPVPLQRAWCLFELWVASEAGIDLTMCFGASDADALREAITSGSFNVAKIVGEIRAQDAGAMEAQDKQLILGLIEASTGIEEFNRLMQAHMLQCLGDTVTTVLARAHAKGGLAPQATLKQFRRLSEWQLP